VDRDLAAIAQGVPEFRLLARADLDTCSRGENNWKTRDPFRSRCQMRVAVAYTFAGELAPRAMALHAVLSGRGWNGRGIPLVLDEYWDAALDQPRYRSGPPETQYQQGTPTPPSSQTLTDIPRVLHIAFFSGDDPDRYTRGFTASMARIQDVQAQGFRFLEYYRTFSGTPYAAPWLAVRQPGTRLVVLMFSENYVRN